MRPQPHGHRPPTPPPTKIALGGTDDDDDQAWFGLQEALRQRTGALLGPFELMAEQHLRWGPIPGPGIPDLAWPFDTWLIRALDHLSEMPPEEVRILLDLYFLQCRKLRSKLTQEAEDSFTLWRSYMKQVEARLAEFPPEWHAPNHDRLWNRSRREG